MATITPTIGSISTGTLRTEDLLVTFANELERISDDADHAATVEDAQRVAYRLENDPDGKDADAIENGPWFIDELTEALDSLAPPYCYFGTHPSDGADFGFWPSIESLEEDIYQGFAIKIDAGDDMPDPDQADAVMSVTDHGNVTCFVAANHKWIEVWAIV